MDVLENEWPTWDPDYSLYDREDEHSNKPVDPDAWADTDYEGDF